MESTKAPAEIVIVENDNIYGLFMGISLHEKAKKRGIEIKITHFTSLIPAHRYLETNSSTVSVISTDMGFPFIDDACSTGKFVADNAHDTEMFAGVELIAILKELGIRTPIVIYSDKQKDVIQQKIKEFELESFPDDLIFKKSYDVKPCEPYDCDQWAEAVLSLIK